MKVLLFNGSPHKEGCTYTALTEIAKTLKEEGIDSEIYQIGMGSITPCRGCFACQKLGRCVINDDKVNEFVDYIQDFTVLFSVHLFIMVLLVVELQHF